MEKQYSVAIYPSEAVIALVKSMKEQLADEVGWFNSKNSVAHITICEFIANDASIEIIKNKLNLLCDSFEPFEVYLNDFDSYSNGAFVITPNEDSKIKLKVIMKKITQSLRSLKMEKSSNPHMSIGRKLKPENLEIAKHLFTTINTSFLCDTIVLRKFDDTIKQFVVTDSFKFNNNPKIQGIQGTLF
ncbi:MULTISPECIES: 2'-5' RNA ligase family protein [Flavobacterium]|uniref:2'-5' RNA ligase family protein n=1 Tax=Flavobacterium algoritolerans TaxID=3041254 RepID=A0ABT6VDP2_9FLAO|nr:MULTISPECIES: 2'-5' RNA ligase family protein [Flavobacterium]MDI5889172.1 2'-5' RNA ligase family protein [Flavobacterium yafengii]MDI5896334.1 2'-5' RNA ligase family protein [Flavobacterium algoritolerans]